MPLFLGTSLCLEQKFVLGLSPLMLIVACIAVPVALSFLGLKLTRNLVPLSFLKKHHDVTGPLYTTLGTIYGIFLALIVSTTWQFYSTTSANLVQEARCLGAMHSDAEAYAPAFRDQLRKIIREYRDALVEQEWRTLAKGEASPEANRLLDQLTEAYTHHKMTDASEATFFHESVVNLNHIRALRSSRLDDASSGLLPFLWWVLVVGGVATVGFSFLFGAENFRAQAIMTMLITGVIFLAFYTIVNLDFPYSGVVAIPSTPFQELIFK